VPGAYTVRLTADGTSDTAPLTVKMDPRVHMSQAELESLHAAQVRMAETLDAMAKADLEAHSVMQQADGGAVKTLATFKEKLKQIVDGDESDVEKRLPGIDDLTAEATQLYGKLEQADAVPTSALLAAAAHIQEERKVVLPNWEDFKQKQLPELNRQLQLGHHPPIQPNQQPTNMPDSGDED
jgi:hypothetical protein